MDVIKYFYEEPAALEVLAPNDDPDARGRRRPTASLAALLDAPRYYRGYLAGTDLATGHVGLTAIAHPAAFLDPLLDWLPETHWLCCRTTGPPVALDAAALRDVLRTPADTVLLVGADTPPPDDVLEAAAVPERRHALQALHRLLDRSRLVCFPETAHHGHDWSFFAAHPLQEQLAEVFRQHPHADVRRFVLPFRQARSEEKFYFEAYDLSRFAAFEVK